MMPGMATTRAVRPIVFWQKYRPAASSWWAWLFTPLVRPLQWLLRPWLREKLANLILKVRRPSIALRHQMAGLERGVEPSYADIDRYLRLEAAKIGLNPDELHIDHFLVHTAEGAVLDSLGLSLQPQERCTKATLVLSGNTVRFEHNYALNALLDELKNSDGTPAYERRAVAFNYASVGKSRGPCNSFSCLIDNARAQAAQLLSNDAIEAKNLTINAHSLGAMIGTTVAAELHDAGHPVRFGHDRSGSSFTEIVVGYVWEYFDRRGYTRTAQVLCELARPLIWAVVRLANWEIDVVTPFLRIPATHTHVATLRSSHRDRQEARHAGTRRGDDRNIVHRATLYYGIKHRIQNGLAYSRHTFKGLMRGLLADEQVTVEQYKETRRDLRTPKYYAMEKRERDAHGRARRELKSRSGKDAGSNLYQDYLHFRDTPPSHPQKRQEERWAALLPQTRVQARPSMT